MKNVFALLLLLTTLTACGSFEHVFSGAFIPSKKAFVFCDIATYGSFDLEAAKLSKMKSKGEIGGVFVWGEDVYSFSHYGGSTKLMRLSDLTEQSVFDFKERITPGATAVDLKGKTVVVGREDGKITLISMLPVRVIRTFGKEQSEIHAVVLLGDDVWVGNDDGRVAVYSASTGKLKGFCELAGGGESGSAVWSLAKVGNAVVAGTPKGMVLFPDSTITNRVAIAHSTAVESFAALDAHRVVVGDGEGGLAIFDVKLPAKVPVFKKVLSGEVRLLHVLPDSDEILTCSDTGKVKVIKTSELVTP